MFGFCITHILNTGRVKFGKKIRRQKVNVNLYFEDQTQVNVQRQPSFSVKQDLINSETEIHFLRHRQQTSSPLSKDQTFNDV